MKEYREMSFEEIDRFFTELMNKNNELDMKARNAYIAAKASYDRKVEKAEATVKKIDAQLEEIDAALKKNSNSAGTMHFFESAETRKRILDDRKALEASRDDLKRTRETIKGCVFTIDPDAFASAKKAYDELDRNSLELKGVRKEMYVALGEIIDKLTEMQKKCDTFSYQPNGGLRYQRAFIDEHAPNSTK